MPEEDQMRYRTGTGARTHVIDTEDGKVLGGCVNAATAAVICSTLNSMASELERLRAALTPFARAAASFSGDDPDDIFKISTLRVWHLRDAARALSETKK